MRKYIICLLILSSCVSKASHRALAESYRAYQLSHRPVYLGAYEVAEVPTSVYASKVHEEEVVAAVISSALKESQ